MISAHLRVVGLALAIVILPTMLHAGPTFVRSGNVLYLHRSVGLAGGKSGYFTELLTATRRDERAGFIVSPYTATNAIFRNASRALAWTFKGKTVANRSCYSGGVPQVAVSPNGKAFVCIDGIDHAELLLFRDISPKEPLQVTSLVGVDPQQVGRAIAFYGDDAVVFLRLASEGACPTFQEAEPTLAVLRSLKSGKERVLGCAISLVERGYDLPAIVKKTSDDGYAYSVNGGGAWQNGNLAAACGADLFFWEGHSGKITSPSGASYDSPYGTNIVTCQIAS